MNTRLKILTTTSAALLLGLVWTGSTMAQQPAPAMPDPETDRVSCTDVSWHRDLLRHYPWVVEACQEAIIVDGQKWVRFEGEFQQLHRDGAITSNFRNDRGRSLGSVRLMPGSDQRVLLDYRPYRFSELQRGQIVNFYVPDDMYAFTTVPGAPASEVVQIVEPPVAEPVDTTGPGATSQDHPASHPAGNGGTAADHCTGRTAVAIGRNHPDRASAPYRNERLIPRR